MKHLAAAGLTAALLAAVCAPSHAGQRGNADLRRSCAGDAATFCGDVDPGGRAMDACFRRHRGELSRQCRRAIDAYRSGGRR